MILAGIFIAELFILHLLSKKVWRHIGSLLLIVTKNQKISAYILALVFLPGTFFHEISHLLASLMLFVPVKKFNLWPKFHAGGITLGSVEVQKSDRFRRLMIGIAPVLSGIILIIGILYFAYEFHLFNNKWHVFLIAYLLFVIANTMFSSKKDMEGSLLITVVIITAFIILGGIIGYNKLLIESANFFAQPSITNLLQIACSYLLIPILIDMLIVIIFKITGK